jgi:hypothetical protein
MRPFQTHKREEINERTLFFPDLTKKIVRFCFESCGLAADGFKLSSAVVDNVRPILKRFFRQFDVVKEYDGIRIGFPDPSGQGELVFVAGLAEFEALFTDKVEIEMFMCVVCRGQFSPNLHIKMQSYNSTLEYDLKRRYSAKMKALYDSVKNKPRKK